METTTKISDSVLEIKTEKTLEVTKQQLLDRQANLEADLLRIKDLLKTFEIKE